MSTTAEDLLRTSPVALVLRDLVTIYPDLPPLMIVGAECRDMLHRTSGYSGELRRTDDLDLALAVDGWDHYLALTDKLDRVPGATSGIRFLVSGVPVDLMPFGRAVEVPDGAVTPAPRRDAMSVFGFQDVWTDSVGVEVEGIGLVRLPSVAGYTLLKLRAWLDRAAVSNYKDAGDLACAMYWCIDPEGRRGTFPTSVRDRLYDSAAGQDHLVATEFDEGVALVRQLAADARALLSPARQLELSRDWADGPEDALLAANLANPLLPGWPRAGSERLADFAAAVRQVLVS